VCGMAVVVFAGAALAAEAAVEHVRRTSIVEPVTLRVNSRTRFKPSPLRRR